ncbi:MAG: hypothetical protein HOH09_03000 [Proteobacteria bacterium]|jgi:hypothetical protein|nr:hypothetical protein [Pseudomonadota bacterium]
MKKFLVSAFCWSWLVTLPICIIGGYLTYRTIDRTYTFSIRYGSNAEAVKLDSIARYEVNQLVNHTRVQVKRFLAGKKSELPTISLVLPEPQKKYLHEHLPQSGFDYVKGGVFLDDQLRKMKLKYRGDTFYRWAWDKKSLRVKTSKKHLYDGLRAINLLAPRTEEQLNNFFSYRLADQLGLLAPRTDLIRLFINGKDRGVHTLVEQIDEGTIRNAGLMPGDIYRGEILGKDKFGPGAPVDSLFYSAAVWDKVAVNNHFDELSKKPLDLLIDLIKRSDSTTAQAQLSEIMDIKAWGRFSAFESLTQSSHTDQIHNWRIYFDPWRSQFVPIVWDAMGWHGTMRGVPVEDPIIVNTLMAALFKNGDFIRARDDAMQSFFLTGQDVDFLQFVNDTVRTAKTEFQNDSYLHPPNSELIIDQVDRWAVNIEKVFEYLRPRYTQVTKGSEPSAYINDSQVDVVVLGTRPINQLKLTLSEPNHQNFQVAIGYQTLSGEHRHSLSSTIDESGREIVISARLLSDLSARSTEHLRNKVLSVLESNPGVYRITISDLSPDTQITSASFRQAGGWLPLRNLESAPQLTPLTVFPPIKFDVPLDPVIWSGEIVLEGYQELDQPLIIEPGTTVRLKSGATLVLRHRLTAIGTKEAPIRFIPDTENQDPWGAIAILGRGADGSTLSHCEMNNGSGLKGDLFEYSAMLSIHDVKDVVISDCQFRDNHVVDDMVHTVYADIRFDRVLFQNALSDALDLDISTASINDSHFENSGNDAVDLMTTQASITGSTFEDNGDKGISVGENSQLYAVNNKLIGNVVGVQSKDRSTAVLLNQTFKNNKTGLHAYKKNWRYGEGGSIFLGKSTVSSGDISAMAGKRSVIQIFDSYLETPAKGKRVDVLAVDDQFKTNAATSTLFPDHRLIRGQLGDAAQKFPQQLKELANPNRRGRDTHD